MRILRAVIAIAACLGAAAAAAAAAEDTPATGAPRKHVVNLQVENDFFARWADRDQHYSNGLRASVAWQDCAGRGCASRDFLAVAASWDPFMVDLELREERWYGLSIGQSIFTPRDTNRPDPLPGERPYAGWLYLGGSVTYQYSSPDNNLAMQNTFAIEAGVVGPSAGGEQVQNKFHRLIGAAEAHGWSNQLRDEPGFNLIAERRYRSGEAVIGSLEADVIPRLAVSLGNVATYGAAGATLRIGQRLENDFGPPLIRPSLPGSELFQARDFGWYLFIGGAGQAVAQNIFLDGNTFRDSAHVEKRNFVAEAYGGLALLAPAGRISASFVFRSPDYEGPREWDQYGAITLSVAF